MAGQVSFRSVGYSDNPVMRIATFMTAAGLLLAACAASAQAGATTAAPDSAPPSAPVPAPAERAVSLQQALQAARANANVRLARQQLAGAQSDVLSADHRPAPVLTAQAASIDLQNGIGGGDLLGRKRIDKQLGLDWTYERGNKRELRTLAARRGAEAAGFDVDDASVQQELAVAAAFYDLLAAQQRQQQVEALARHAGDMADAAQQRLRAGDIAQQEQLRTEIEARRAAAEVRSAQADLRKASLTLAQLTALAGELRAEGDWPSLADAPRGVPSIEKRPDVQAALRRVAAAEAAFQSALALRSNDLTVGATVHHFPGTSSRMVEVRVQMPLAGLFGNYDYEGEIGHARATLDQAQAQLDKTRLTAQADSARLMADLEATAARAAEFTATIVPRARQVADMAELAYSRGAMSLTELLDARRTLRAVLLDDIQVRAEYARALATWQLRQTPATS